MNNETNTSSDQGNRISMKPIEEKISVSENLGFDLSLYSDE